MLIETLRRDMIAARQGNDLIAKNLLVTLYSEALMFGKNKRNGNPTDEEAVAVVKKFATNIEETIKLLTERGQDVSAQQHELDILKNYLPQQMSESQLVTAISEIIAELPEVSSKFMGKIMSELKIRYGASYDGKLASALVKSALS